MRKTLIPLAAATAILALAGCSSSSTSTSESPSAAQSAATSAASTTSPTDDMTNPVLPPIEINGAESVDVAVGDTLNVTTKDATKVETDNAAVLKVTQPSSDGSAEYNAGAEVVGAGQAKLMVYGADDKELYTVSVTAKAAGE